jgi:hypothetical protein
MPRESVKYFEIIILVGLTEKLTTKGELVVEKVLLT